MLDLDTRILPRDFDECAETEETVRMCPYVELETKLEIVPPDEARRDLAELRQTIYGRAE